MYSKVILLLWIFRVETVLSFGYTILHSQFSQQSYLHFNDAIHFHSKTTKLDLFGNSDGDFEEKDPRKIEFDIAEELENTSIAGEQHMDEKQTFARYGNDLWQLREKLNTLSRKLIESIASGEDTKNIRQEIRHLEAQDANTMYELELGRMNGAINENRLDDAEDHAKNACQARNHLVQFSLEGLWVGKYGDSFEMVNITYAGDTLIAEKLTGDENSSIPQGEISFQVDLSPEATISLNDSTALPNIKLSEEAATRWGTSELQRFSGLGQVADEGFKNNQWMDGQLTLISEDYFSFAWLPLGCQIFFGRPSPELSIAMMKKSMEQKLKKDDVDYSKKHAKQCFEYTVDAICDGSLNDSSDSCIIFEDDIACFE